MFPLKSIVLPGGLFPLRIFERRYINMVKNCLKNDTGFCITLVRGESDNGYITNVYNYGCYVKIVDWNQLEDGLLGITVEGIKKIHVLECNLNEDNLLQGSIEDIEVEKEYMVPQKYLSLSKFYKKITVRRAKRVPKSFLKSRSIKNQRKMHLRFFRIYKIYLA